MKTLDVDDWAELRSLANATGFSEDRVIVAQSHYKSAIEGRNRSAVLVIGRAGCGIELLVAEWLGSNAWASRDKATSEPLIVGGDPDSIRPAEASWRIIKVPNASNDLAVVLAVDEHSDALRTAKAMFNTFEQAVFVTRWTQPLSQSERDLLDKVSEAAHYLHCVVVSLPSEDTSNDNILIMRQFITASIAQTGFQGDRLLGIHMFPLGVSAKAERSGGACVASLMYVDPGRVAGARCGHATRLVTALIYDIATRAKSLPTHSGPILSPEDTNRLEREFDQHLGALRRATEESTRTYINTKDLRSAVVDTAHSWRRDDSLAGIWLKYVEAIRPGCQSALLAEIAAAVDLLDLKPGTQENEQPRSPARQVLKVAAPGAIRIFAALLGGAAASITVSIMAPGFLQAYSLLPSAAMMLGAVLAFSIAGKLTPRVRATPIAPYRGTPMANALVLHWPRFEERLVGWLKAHLAANPATLINRCNAFCRRLEIPLPPS